MKKLSIAVDHPYVSTRRILLRVARFTTLPPIARARRSVLMTQ